MKLYRFSPIQNENELSEAIRHIHVEAHKLCMNAMGEYLPNAGNMGVFCHYDNEYERLVEVRKQLTYPSDNPDQKYFELQSPIHIEQIGDIPAIIYTHLYIRKPDPYRHHVGDVDFYLEEEEYKELKQSLIDGKKITGARVFPRNDLDMIELHDPDSDVLAYVSTVKMSETARVKVS